jgi:hypothetical protein
MTQQPRFAAAGRKESEIEVRLSYRIVNLFSEGLYASPNKAIEELVANAFDAGALSVVVLVPADLHAQTSSIVVVDDGEGMSNDGLRQHWLIGKSNKRKLGSTPKGRNQIGKFGIGKLASYVLANRLTHISKKDGKYYSTSMDYRQVDTRGEDEIEAKAPIKLALRELSEPEAKDALSEWTILPAFLQSNLKLFGKGARPSWTFAVLSDLKEKVHEIRPGVLDWVLRTALPLRDDFAIHLNGQKLVPSKATKGRLKRWVIGREIADLPKPAPSDVETKEDKNEDKNSETRFGLTHPQIGRITGYAEAFKELLTGQSGNAKSEELGRSHGFFVYVLGRLINVVDGHFGIRPDELRHGTFGRVRIVVHIDGLDPMLQSDRERLREGPELITTQNILRAIFNFVRAAVEKYDNQEDVSTRLARKLGGSPTSLSRRPIIEMARAAMDGKIRSRYLQLPNASTQQERDKVVTDVEERAKTPDTFVSSIAFAYDATSDDGIAVYDIATGQLRINGLHPFVGAFFDEYTSRASGLPLEIFSMAEVLLESQLHQSGAKQVQIDEVMRSRDQLLRSVAAESGRRTALSIANALRNARNDEDQLEIELVECFRSLGFDATRVGGRGKPDGVAKAHLSPTADKDERRYAVTLEAKSKQKDGATVSAKSVGISAIARQRNEYACQHAIVVGPAFPTKNERNALADEIRSDRETSDRLGSPKTVTLMHIDDLARLVQLQPVKRVGLKKIRELLQKCSLPDECKQWVDDVEKTNVAVPPYAKIIKAIHQLQSESRNEPVTLAELRNELKHLAPPILYNDLEELTELCKGMAQMAPRLISCIGQSIELDTSPQNVIKALETAMKEHLAGGLAR